MGVDEETETDEEPVVIVMKSITRSVADRVKEKKKEKDVPHKTSIKNTESMSKKTPQRTYVGTKRKVEEITVGELLSKTQRNIKKFSISDPYEWA